MRQSYDSKNQMEQISFKFQGENQLENTDKPLLNFPQTISNIERSNMLQDNQTPLGDALGLPPD